MREVEEEEEVEGKSLPFSFSSFDRLSKWIDDWMVSR